MMDEIAVEARRGLAGAMRAFALADADAVSADRQGWELGTSPAHRRTMTLADRAACAVLSGDTLAAAHVVETAGPLGAALICLRMGAAPAPRVRAASRGYRVIQDAEGAPMAPSAQPAAANSAPGQTRLDRRKARTRQALIDAAVGLIAEGRGERASIQEIAEAADIGFGSFYNHFESKDELFRTASEEVLERWGQMIDRACADLDDPAEVFATSVRISGRLGWTHPDLARFIIGAGLDLLDIPRGLAPRALRDIKLGQAAGRFTIPNADVALSTVAGGLLGLLRVHQHHPEQIDETAVDQLAEAILRMFGIPAREAKRIAARELPDIAAW